MSEVLDPPVDAMLDPVAAALEVLESALDQLGAAQLWALGNAELLDSTARVHRLLCRGDAVLHGLVREMDARGAAVQAGAVSTAGWLRGRLRLHPGAAKRLVATALALHDDPTGPLVPHETDPNDSEDRSPGGRADLRDAFAAGEVSGEHAAVACQALDQLPAGLASDTVAAAETYLVEQARLHDPKGLAHLGRHLRHVLDPDAGDRLAADAEHQVATRHLDVRQRPDGSGDLRGRLDPELTAALLAQLHTHGAPRPERDGATDLRPTGKRHADALADILTLAAGAPGAPTRHGTRPVITVTMALETLQRRLGTPGATLDWAGPVGAETARRLACDARVIPVVLGAHGEPLDVGRASYPVPAAIWRALVTRDHGCAFAGCDRPPEWTEAHHRTHWADGGETSVANCVLLCDHHHRAVHHHGWDLQLIDGAIHTIPPPWVDPTQTPRRNTGRPQLAPRTTFPPHPD